MLDTFAVLAWLANEPGAVRVQEILEQAGKGQAKLYISWVNVSEVSYVLRRFSSDQDTDLRAIKGIEGSVLVSWLHPPRRRLSF